MAGLKMAMINGIKPMPGSGDGITEYAYSMCAQMRKRGAVKLVYSIEQAKKNDAVGLLQINSMLKMKAADIGNKDYDIYHLLNHEVGFAAKAIKLADKSNKIVTTVHDLARFQNGLHVGILQTAYSRMVMNSVKDAVFNSDFLIFDSNQTMRDVRNRFGNVKGEVVNIGIDERMFSSAKPRKREKFSVGYIGSFAHHKNVPLLLRAAKLLRDDGVEFCVYGVGTEKGLLEQYVKDNSLKCVHLMGFADESKKREIYDGFSVFVFPSMYEGFGLPILEAQARGLPVIIYKKGKISEEIRKYCIEADDEEHMAELIMNLKKNGYGERRRSEAIRYARSFTWKRCASKTFNIYNKVLQ